MDPKICLSCIQKRFYENNPDSDVKVVTRLITDGICFRLYLVNFLDKKNSTDDYTVNLCFAGYGPDGRFVGICRFCTLPVLMSDEDFNKMSSEYGPDYNPFSICDFNDELVEKSIRGVEVKSCDKCPYSLEHNIYTWNLKKDVFS